MTLNRLYKIKRRLSKDLDLRRSYCDFMRANQNLGHMKPAKQSGEYCIPHHAMVIRNKKGLKIRVVFDASARSSSE